MSGILYDNASKVR